MSDKVQIYQLVLDDGSDTKKLESLVEQVQEQKGKIVEVSPLTASISVGFPDNEKAPILQGGSGYTVEQTTEVEAKWFWLVPAAFLGAGIGAAAIINK